MAFVLPQGAAQRSRDAIHAAAVFRSQAATIAAACAVAPAESMVVALVERDLRFAGAQALPAAQVWQQLADLEGDGWTLVFTAQTAEPEIQARCQEFAELAELRRAAIERWISRRS
jgi:hypothetical protein